MFIAKKRIYTDASQKIALEEGNPLCAFLIFPKGAEINLAQVNRYKLIEGQDYEVDGINRKASPESPSEFLVVGKARYELTEPTPENTIVEADELASEEKIMEIPKESKAVSNKETGKKAILNPPQNKAISNKETK
jgi:hypothetical protein